MILILYCITIFYESPTNRNGGAMDAPWDRAQLETPTDPWNRNHFGDAWESQ